MVGVFFCVEKMDKPTLVIALGKARGKKEPKEEYSEGSDDSHSGMMAEFDARLCAIEEKLGIEKKEKSKEE